MIDIVSLIPNVGFPIAISLYFIFKVEKVVKNNTEALIEFKLSTQNLRRGR